MAPCVVADGLKAIVKRAVFDLLPAMPVAEAVQRRVQASELQSIEAREDAEVATVLRGRAPIRADVITVMATYKRPELLRRAVASALDQPAESHALVVVDDGAGEVPRFDDPRVNVINLTANIGICGVVRNVGIRCSESRFVAFLDDDNWWERDHLSRSLGALSQGAAFSYSGVRVVSTAGVVLRETCTPFDRRRLRHTNFVDASSIVAQRAPNVLFSRLRRARGGARHEDWEFAHRVSGQGEVRHVPAVTVNYLDNPDSHYRWIDQESGAPDEAPQAKP